MGAVTEYGSALDGATFEKSVGEVVSAIEAKAVKVREAEDAAEERLRAVEAEKAEAVAEAEAKAEETGGSKPCGRWDEPAVEAAGGGTGTDNQGNGIGVHAYSGTDGATRPIGEVHSNGRHRWGLKNDGYYGWVTADRFKDVYGDDVAGEFDARLSKIRSEGRWLCTFAECYENYARQLRGASEGEKLRLTLSDLTYYGFSEDPALDEKIAGISEL